MVGLTERNATLINFDGICSPQGLIDSDLDMAESVL